MKRLLALAAAALFAATVHAADQLPLFNATLTVGKDHRFILIAQPEGKSSGWLRLGETFAGYTLKAYDAKANALEVERDGKVSRIAIVADAATGAAAMSATPATLADAEAVMNKIHIDELLDRSIEQQKKAIATMMGRSLPANVPDNMKQDIADFQQRVMDEVTKLIDPVQMKADITRIYSETFSKEELNQISSFYDTPLGQTLLAKQPEVQQKMQAAMIPRMAEIGPKIQQMGREFGAQMKAKQAAAAGVPAPAPAGTP
jgi:uncharacterized protein